MVGVGTIQAFMYRNFYQGISGRTISLLFNLFPRDSTPLLLA